MAKKKKVSYFSPKAYVPNDFKEKTEPSQVCLRKTLSTATNREHLGGNYC